MIHYTGMMFTKILVFLFFLLLYCLQDVWEEIAKGLGEMSEKSSYDGVTVFVSQHRTTFGSPGLPFQVSYQTASHSRGSGRGILWQCAQ